MFDTFPLRWYTRRILGTDSQHFQIVQNVRNILIFGPGNYVQKQTPPKICCTNLITCTARRWCGMFNLNVLKAAIYPKTSQDHFETHLSTILLMAELLHQLIGSLSLYLQGFVNPRWCRISSINSMFHSLCGDEISDLIFTLLSPSRANLFSAKVGQIPQKATIWNCFFFQNCQTRQKEDPKRYQHKKVGFKAW